MSDMSKQTEYQCDVFVSYAIVEMDLFCIPGLTKSHRSITLKYSNQWRIKPDEDKAIF